MQACLQCKKDFIIRQWDRDFYKKIQVTEPKCCPDCRLVRRFMERNPKTLYYRKCDLTGAQTLSQYHKDQPFPVYCPKAWWSDGWDGLDYGMDFDFSKPFFEQFYELKKRVPHCALFNTEGTTENSDFNNCTAYIKNCYLIAESDHCEDCYYSNLIKKSRNLADCSVCYECELCYECVDCTTCYRLLYSQDCQNCKDGSFLYNCVSCTECVGCINQRHKEYMIFNTQYSKQEYEKRKEKLALNTPEGVEKTRKECERFFLEQPRRHVIAEHNENSSGDHLFNSKNAYCCFDSRDLEDCAYCAKLTLGTKSSMDYNSWGSGSELMYQCAGVGDHCYNCRFCVLSQTNMRDCDYCYECFGSSNLFGCVGLKKQEYCILNKKYSKETFHQLKKRIIEYMRKTGEWGEFFPVLIGAFAYNESLAMDVFPLTRKEALQKGFRWRDEEVKTPRASSDPSIKTCGCGKSFKIIEQERSLYEKLSLPLPQHCPACRHKARMGRRNPLELRERACSKCNEKILTSYPSSCPEKIYCEKCYLVTVY